VSKKHLFKERLSRKTGSYYRLSKKIAFTASAKSAGYQRKFLLPLMPTFLNCTNVCHRITVREMDKHEEKAIQGGANIQWFRVSGVRTFYFEPGNP
jgi:hypothetical protein